MKLGVVLSIFPGLDVLGMGFEAQGYCVVQGPDVIHGRDLREWDPTPLRGSIDGVIGGDPCQSHSQLANLVRAKGLEPSFPDMTEDFARIVADVSPIWFLRENVATAPDVAPKGYAVTSFVLDNCWLGESQKRKRRFWFGWRPESRPAPNLMRWIRQAPLERPIKTVCVDSGHDKLDGAESIARYRTQGVTGRHSGEIGITGGHRGSPARYTLQEMLELQGLRPGLLDEAPFTMEGKRKLVGNAVPLSMAIVIARAVEMATGGAGDQLPLTEGST